MSYKKEIQPTFIPKLAVGAPIVAPSDRGEGIQIGLNSPDWGWRDLIGAVSPRTVGAKTPTLDVFRSPIRAYRFKLNDVVDFMYHLPHDYVPNSPLYVHVHWSHTGTAISGNIEYTHNHTYAKGHQQAVFPAATELVQTVVATDTPQYQHVISEVELDIAPSLIEPDGMIIAKLEVTGLPTITGGNLFVLFADIHYQSTNIGTVSKSPDFYSRGV